MKIQVCVGKKCQANFSQYIISRLENDKEKFDIANIEIIQSPCMGGCSNGPNIKIDEELFERINPAKASELLFKKLKNVTIKKHKNKKTRTI